MVKPVSRLRLFCVGGDFNSCLPEQCIRKAAVFHQVTIANLSSRSLAL